MGNTKQYSAGDKVTYRVFGGKTRTVVVESRSEDIKDGKPGFDAVCGAWGYDDQIVRVEPKKK